MKKKILISIFCIFLISFNNIFASNINIHENKNNISKNTIIGQITNITENEVIIILAQDNKPKDAKNNNRKEDDKQNKPKNDLIKDSKNISSSSEPIEIKDIIKLTSTKKTYNIKNAKFLTNNNKSNTSNDNSYKSFNINDYVILELKDKESTEVITMKKFDNNFKKYKNEPIKNKYVKK